MKIIVTKEELLELCSKCAEMVAQGKSCDVCPFSTECGGAYIDFWRDNTEIKESDSK
jgi:MoaA/NifB/PqqE/SkfB family radical SAM enzyme